MRPKPILLTYFNRFRRTCFSIVLTHRTATLIHSTRIRSMMMTRSKDHLFRHIHQQRWLDQRLTRIVYGLKVFQIRWHIQIYSITFVSIYDYLDDVSSYLALDSSAQAKTCSGYSTVKVCRFVNFTWIKLWYAWNIFYRRVDFLPTIICVHNIIHISTHRRVLIIIISHIEVLKTVSIVQVSLTNVFVLNSSESRRQS